MSRIGGVNNPELLPGVLIGFVLGNITASLTGGGEFVVASGMMTGILINAGILAFIRCRYASKFLTSIYLLLCIIVITFLAFYPGPLTMVSAICAVLGYCILTYYLLNLKGHRLIEKASELNMEMSKVPLDMEFMSTFIHHMENQRIAVPREEKDGIRFVIFKSDFWGASFKKIHENRYDEFSWVFVDREGNLSLSITDEDFKRYSFGKSKDEVEESFESLFRFVYECFRKRKFVNINEILGKEKKRFNHDYL